MRHMLLFGTPPRGMSYGLCKKVFRMSEPVRTIPLRTSPTGTDWGLIHWKYLNMQALRRFLGHYPDVLRKRGVLRVKRWSLR